ncbi:hypothetical protein [Calothrix sp. UHCC 0171]|nr:hypothetical protein [Calothrix sp. UHCC 0171]MEA5570164.1 hypothetical protein [Calothrix sp. UHCC 0171]
MIAKAQSTQFTSSLQMSRYRNRGSIYLFAPMVEFNVMAEVGDAPP